MGKWYRFRLAEPLDALAQEELMREVPGAKVTSPNFIVSGENCAWLVGDWLASRRAGWTLGAESALIDLDFDATKLRIEAQLRPNALTPLPYQWRAVAKLRNRNGDLIWPTGSGKTLASILWCLSNSVKPERIIYVTRGGARSTIYEEWKRQTYIEPIVLRGETVDADQTESAKNASVIIVGWETLHAWVDFLKTLKATSLVMDEIHLAKNHARWKPVIGADGTVSFSLKENRAAAAMELSQSVKFRLGMTATPIPDRLRDLWAQLDLVEPNQWGGYWVWAKRYVNAIPGQFGGLEDKGKAEQSIITELRSRVSFVWNRVTTAETHAELPAKRRQVIYLSSDEQDRPAAFASEMKRAAKRNKESLLHCKLLEAASRKRSRVVRMACDQLASGGKVVIFTGRRAEVESIFTKVRECAPESALCFPITGDDSTTRRDQFRHAYMDHTGAACIVATGDSMGESVNLQDTDLAIFAMLPWSPGTLRQWEGRFSRLGQKRPVLISYVISEGTVDERVASIILDKLPAVEAIVGDEELRGVGAELMGDPEALTASLISKLLADSDAVDEFADPSLSELGSDDLIGT